MWAECCKKLESRLVAEHKQHMSDIGRQLGERDLLIQQYEVDNQVYSNFILEVFVQVLPLKTVGQ